MTEQSGFCRVNAVELRETPHSETLLEWLRDTAGQVDVHQGCDTGHCGSCAVLLDGMPVKSCSMLALEADGRDIHTLSGLTQLPHREVQAVLKATQHTKPFQCGYCVAPFLLAAIGLLRKVSSPTEDEVRHAFTGVLCRCTGYQSIVDMVLAAARILERDNQEDEL